MIPNARVYYPVRLFLKEGNFPKDWGEYLFAPIDLAIPCFLGLGAPLGVAVYTFEGSSLVEVVKKRMSYGDDLITRKEEVKGLADLLLPKVESQTAWFFEYTPPFKEAYLIEEGIPSQLRTVRFKNSQIKAFEKHFKEQVDKKYGF